MKNKKMIFVLSIISILLFLPIFSSVAIEDPDYTITLGPGEKVYFEYEFIKGTKLKIEFEVISGGNKDVDFYIKNSDGNTVEDWGRVVSGLVYFIAPYDDKFRIYFSNAFSIITSKTIEISFDIIAYGKSITINSPKTNDIFDNGYNYIEWSTTGSISYVRIELYYGNSFLEVIDSSTYNDGSYTWYLSSSDTYSEGSYYQIRISDYYDDSIYVFSDYFTIEIDPSYDPYDDTKPDNFSLGWLLLIIFPTIACVVIIVINVKRHKKKKLKDTIQPEKTSEVQEKKIPEIAYCPECGTEILDKSRKFCSVCGTKIIK